MVKTHFIYNKYLLLNGTILIRAFKELNLQNGDFGSILLQKIQRLQEASEMGKL
jgi:hypothetical protein